MDYFINMKIIKSIANEIYRDAGYGLENNNGWYVVYDSDNNTIAFAVNKEYEDETKPFKHFTICFNNDDGENDNYFYYSTDTLNRRELADKLESIIKEYEYLKELK